MNLTDLLRMSIGNLKRRKLRTFLTVLGVVIGTASIVVMISLGLGLQQSMYEEVENSGGLTTITVRGKGVGDGMFYYGEEESEDAQYITDEVISDFQTLEHVTLVAPVYEMSAYLIKGNYECWTSLIGTTAEALASQNMKIKEGGSFMPEGGTVLEPVFGSNVATQFYEKKTGKGYWETGELPVDLENDSVFMILDMDVYYQSSMGGMSGEFGEGSGTQRTAKKHVVKAAGIEEGDINSYSMFCYNTYCDITALKNVLRKEFAGRAIPGQPTTKSGKPFNFFAYSSATLKIDDLDNVEPVAQNLRDMGYNVESNIEYLEYAQQQFAIVQAVLGGIGAVSLLVAAIGIANTMMMSIYERTKEIGVFKVLGCSLRNIRQMFLMEAAFIGLLGGVVGNIFSFIISKVINFVVGGAGLGMGMGSTISYIPLWLALVSMGFAVLVGMIAGYFPALRAMRLSPLAAIRNE